MIFLILGTVAAHDFRKHPIKEGEKLTIHINGLFSPIRPIPINIFRSDSFQLPHSLSAQFLNKENFELAKFDIDQDKKKLFINYINNSYKIDFSVKQPGGIASKYRDSALIGVNNGDNMVIYKKYTLTVSYAVILGKNIIQNLHVSSSEEVNLENTNSIVISADIMFKEVSLEKTNSKKWMFVGNSIIITILLILIIIWLVCKTAIYESKRKNILDDDDPLEEMGWKLIHGDVFRSPRRVIYLSSLVGSGAQIIASLILMFILWFIGYSEITFKKYVYCYLLSALASGFFSAKLFKTLGDKEWRKNLMVSGTLCNGVGFVLFIGAFIVFYLQKSLAMISLTKVFMFFVANFVLHSIGSILAFVLSPYPLPARVNQLPRQIPQQPVILKPYVTMSFSSFISFLIIILQLNAIFPCIWNEQCGKAYIETFFVALICFFITSSILSILCVYEQLLYEDYKWWWNAFLHTSATGVFYYIYAVYYLFFRCNFTDTSSKVVYISINLLISFILSIASGAAGFFGSFGFVRMIYESLKME